MINENKVKMLTKLAVFEKKIYRSPEEIRRLSRKKFVAKGIWWTFCAATVAFIIVLVIWTLYQNNLEIVFTDFLNGRTYMFTNARLWIEYIIFSAAFVIIAFIFYNKKYTRLSSEINEYIRRQNNYEDFYTRKDTQEP